MENRETPWGVLLTCVIPVLFLGVVLFVAPWDVTIVQAVALVPPCVALVYVLISHEALVNEMRDVCWKAEQTLELTPKPVAPQSPPTQQGERDEVVLGVLENVKSHAATKAAPVAAAAPIPATNPAPVAAPVPAPKPAPVTTVDKPPIPKEPPPKIQPVTATALDGAKYLPHTGNPPKEKSFHFVRPERAAIPKALRHSNYNVAVTNGSDITEEALLDMAHEERRVIVSTNVDFEILAAHGRKHAGILIIPRDAKAETILAACRAIWSKVPQGRKDQGGDL